MTSKDKKLIEKIFVMNDILPKKHQINLTKLVNLIEKQFESMGQQIDKSKIRKHLKQCNRDLLPEEVIKEAIADFSKFA